MPVDATSSDFATSLCCLAILLFGGIGLVMLFSRRRKRPAVQPPSTVVLLADLNQQASGKLVDADNALRTSEQELGFAVAQYGQEATAAFSAALTASKQDIAQAFRLRQQLDDAIPEDEPTQRTMLQQIISLCDSADKRLDAEADTFHRLRAMESQVEQLADDLTSRRDAAERAMPLAQQTWQDLSSRYAGTALNAIAGNTEQAKTRIDFASTQLAEARASIAANDRATAALRIRASEQALGQAAMLLDALVKVKTDLEKAQTDLSSLLAETQGQVAAGKAAMQASGSNGGPDQMNLAASVARAEQIVTDVRTEQATDRTLTALPAAHGEPLPGSGSRERSPAAKSDPVAALRRLESVAGELNAALTGIRDAASQAQQARGLLSQAIFAARTNIDAVTDFITTRRGAIGTQARTALMEAQRQLELATNGSQDPVAALTAAQRSSDLADRALEQAQSDVNQWPGYGGYGGGGGPVIVTGPGGGMGGAVLGGILIDSMFGGGMRGGGRIRLGLIPSTPAPGRFGGPSTWART